MASVAAAKASGAASSGVMSLNRIPGFGIVRNVPDQCLQSPLHVVADSGIGHRAYLRMVNGRARSSPVATQIIKRGDDRAPSGPCASAPRRRLDCRLGPLGLDLD